MFEDKEEHTETSTLLGIGNRLKAQFNMISWTLWFDRDEKAPDSGLRLSGPFSGFKVWGQICFIPKD